MRDSVINRSVKKNYRLPRISAWVLIGRRAFNRGGRLLPFPVGNQAYLSSIRQFTHRVIVAIETGFP